MVGEYANKAQLIQRQKQAKEKLFRHYKELVIQMCFFKLSY